MKARFLTNRLKTIFLKNSNQSFFDFYKRNPERIERVLSHLIRIEDDRVHISGAGWRFDYEGYLKAKGYKITQELGFNEGVIYEIKKI